MLSAWLEAIILKSARDLSRSDKALLGFEAIIRKGLSDKPIQEWEADRWARGVKRRLIRMEGYFFRVGTGKAGCLSFFVRNDKGLHVGFRRESITQAATYVSLVTDYGYPRDATRFESGWMDVAVYDEADRALIYAENKAAAKTLDKLCHALSERFRSGIPFVEDEEPRHDDALMKAQHIWRHRPRYFWGVAPTLRRCYRVDYSREGFSLREAPGLPTLLEWVSLDPTANTATSLPGLQAPAR